MLLGNGDKFLYWNLASKGLLKYEFLCIDGTAAGVALKFPVLHVGCRISAHKVGVCRIWIKLRSSYHIGRETGCRIARLRELAHRILDCRYILIVWHLICEFLSRGICQGDVYYIRFTIAGIVDELEACGEVRLLVACQVVVYLHGVQYL